MVGVETVITATGQRGCQVEPEPVDVEFLHPITQRVQHHPRYHRLPGVQGVPAARDVDVSTAFIQPVVGAVVQPAPTQRRPTVARLLAGVVVDHVENDFNAGGVQGLDRALDLVNDLGGFGGRGVAGVRGEEPHRVIAPVVGATLTLQVRLVGEGVDGQQLQRRDAQRAKVLDDRRMPQRRIGAADALRDLGVQHGQALDVRFVDHGVGPRDRRGEIAGPVESVAEHHTAWHVWGAVPFVSAWGVVVVAVASP